MFALDIKKKIPNTVKPEYNDHPRDLKNCGRCCQVVVVQRFLCTLIVKLGPENSGLCKQVVVNSGLTVMLYSIFWRTDQETILFNPFDKSWIKKELREKLNETKLHQNCFALNHRKCQWISWQSVWQFKWRSIFSSDFECCCCCCCCICCWFSCCCCCYCLCDCG